MKTAERLANYYPFDQDVIDQVAASAETQARYGSYQEFFDAVGVAEPSVHQFSNASSRSVLDIQPREHDPAKALVMHLPMANPLDTNQLYQIGSVAHALPETRIIAMGNPSGGRYNSGSLTRSQRRKVSDGNFSPVIDPLAECLDEKGVASVLNVGGSYGAELAAAFASKGSHEVQSTVYIEPASLVSRNVLQLGLDFKSSEPAMQVYVDANELQTFLEARKDAVTAKEYISGLLRLSNIAIARGLAKGLFELHALNASRVQSEMVASFAWGSESELALDAVMTRIVQTYRGFAGQEYVNQVIRLEGQKHAAGNDLALTNAVILQSLKS